MIKFEDLPQIVVNFAKSIEENDGKIDFTVLHRAVAQITIDWLNGVDMQLNGMIADWENTMGDDDKTLYTLGLRRAQDIIHGRDPMGTV